MADWLKPLVTALALPTPWWARPIEEDPEPKSHLVCGVPDCEDGIIVQQDERTTVVECAPHGARTTHDTVKREPREQTIIRAQDGWRQHGSSAR